MQDVKDRLERLRADAEECLLISRLATSLAKRRTFEKLADEYQQMAQHLEAIIASGEVEGKSDF